MIEYWEPSEPAMNNISDDVEYIPKTNDVVINKFQAFFYRNVWRIPEGSIPFPFFLIGLVSFLLSLIDNDIVQMITWPLFIASAIIFVTSILFLIIVAASFGDSKTTKNFRTKFFKRYEFINSGRSEYKDEQYFKKEISDMMKSRGIDSTHAIKWAGHIIKILKEEREVYNEEYGGPTHRRLSWSKRNWIISREIDGCVEAWEQKKSEQTETN